MADFLLFPQLGTNLDDSSLPYHRFLGHNDNITIFHILTVWKCFENGRGFKSYLMLSVWQSETNSHTEKNHIILISLGKTG